MKTIERQSLRTGPARPIAKDEALAYYEQATRLSYRSSLTDWHNAFPSRARLEQFARDTGGFTWPATYGESPWDTVFSIGYTLANGMTDSTVEFILAHQHNPAVAYQCAVLKYYGFQLSPRLKHLAD